MFLAIGATLSGRAPGLLQQPFPLCFEVTVALVGVERIMKSDFEEKLQTGSESGGIPVYSNAILALL
jgi:hypothetical protein